MPNFEPKPLCGYSSADVTYQLEPVEPWLQISKQTHTIEVTMEKDADYY